MSNMNHSEDGMVRVGAAVVSRRNAMGMSQAELARHAGVSPATMLRIEKGQMSGYRSAIKTRIEDALACPPGTFDAIVAGAAAPTTTDRPLRNARELEDEIVSLRADLLELTQLVARMAGQAFPPGQP